MAKPYMVVRASIDPAVLDHFVRWYQDVHLSHVLEIPGIVRAYRANCHRRGVNWTTVYELEDNAAIQRAFVSAQAERARLDWERWLPFVSEVTVEVYAALGPLPGYHYWN